MSAEDVTKAVGTAAGITIAVLVITILVLACIWVIARIWNGIH